MIRRAAVPLVALLAACTGGTVPTSIAPNTTTTTATPPPAIHFDGDTGVGDRAFPALGNGGYDVVRYDLALDFGDVALASMSGRATITATAVLPLRSFVLDLVAHTVDSLAVDGEPAHHVREDPRNIRVTPETAIAEGDGFEVVVEYSGPVAPVDLTRIPFPTGWQRGDLGTVFLFSEPDGASGVFPSNDHPSDRADVTLEVTVPASLVVVSGGEPRRTSRDGSSTYQFEIPQVAPYLVPLAIGDFVPVASDGVTTWLPTGVDLPPGFERQREILEFMEAELGPYPFDSLGAVVVDSDLAAALETQTMPTYTTASAAWGTQVLAHEIAHHWFGNEITLGQWDDIWLNEGFATFMTWRWIEHDVGRQAYDAEVARARTAVSAPDLPPPDHPVSSELFTASVYQGGGLALAGLRELVGDDGFFDFVRAYVAHFSDRTVTTEAVLAFTLVVLGPEAESFLRDAVSG